MNKSTLLRAFCLEGMFLDRMDVRKSEIVLSVRSPRTCMVCVECARSMRRVHKRVFRRILHNRCDDKPVYLHLLTRTFFCKHCGKRFRETFSGIDRRRTTNHYRTMVLPKARNRSFAEVAREYGCSASGLSRSIRLATTATGILWPEKPFALGIDEHSFSGRDLMMTITDVINNKLLSILPDDRQTTLRHYIRNILKNKQKLITSVCIDMKKSYRSVLTDELPEVPVVVDKFHVIQYLNWHLGELRRVYTSQHYPLPTKLLEKNKEHLTPKERKMLRQIGKQYPAIEELWRLKEWMRAWHQRKNAEGAREHYRIMLDGLLDDRRPRWQTLHATLYSWQPQITNYFTHRVTNAYTEGVHTKIKLLKRISYGFKNKSNYIAKMTLAFLPAATMIKMLQHHPV